jgi:hypothetical protein
VQRFSVVALACAAALTAGAAAAAVTVPRERADVNQDGAVNSLDVAAVVQKQGARADVNGDGIINSGDVGIVVFYMSQPAAPGRDKLRQPFASNSIWNTAVGSGALYAAAGFGMSTGGFTVTDEDYWIVASPSDPLREIIDDKASWSGPRCGSTAHTGVFVRVPDSLVIGDVGDGYYPNRTAAILQADGRTIVQLNAMARCSAGGPVYGVVFPSSDIYGNGIAGAHGGSGLSSIGGTLRRGELLDGTIAHALKVNINCAHFCSPLAGPNGGPGWRWPASTSDAHCGQFACGYGGSVAGLQMGSLLALPPGLKETVISAPGQAWPPGLETEVGRRLFHALQDYGAYVVDDLPWDGIAYAVHVEPGVRQEVKAKYAIDIDDATATDGGADGAYWRDWHRIWLNLRLVTNNGPAAVGGGGTPRVPAPPPIGN